MYITARTVSHRVVQRSFKKLNWCFFLTAQMQSYSLRTGSFLLVGKFGAKRRASGACTHLPKSQLPPTRRTACQLSSFNQSAHAESQNPQQTKNDTREILVFACLFSRKNYLWFKSRDTKPRTITAKLRS